MLRDLYQAIGWAMVHVTWQGAVLWIAWRMIQATVREATVRHRIDWLALLFLACAFLTHVSTFLLASAASTQARSQQGSALWQTVAQLGAPERAPVWRWAVADVAVFCGVAWLCGFLLLGLRNAIAWRFAYHKYVRRAQPAAPALQELTARLARQLSIALPRVVESPHIDSPAVLGVVRPTIVLPTDGYQKLTPVQLEGVLVHELAHVRRRDGLANVVQSVIDALLFFHPAAAGISASIRAQREMICDGAAARACGDPRAYVHGLLALEESRFNSGRIALAARGAHLLERARYLLTREGQAQPRFVRAGAALALLLTALIGIGWTVLPTSLSVAAATAHNITTYTVQAQDPAGHFTITVHRGRAISATIDGTLLDRAQLLQRGNTVTITHRNRSFTVQISTRGGLSWLPRTPR